MGGVHVKSKIRRKGVGYVASPKPYSSIPRRIQLDFHAYVAFSNLQNFHRHNFLQQIHAMAMATSSLSLLPSSFRNLNPSKTKFVSTHYSPSHLRLTPLHSQNNPRQRILKVLASVSVSDPKVQTGPDDLVASILSKVRGGFMLLTVLNQASFVWVLRKLVTTKIGIRIKASSLKLQIGL